MSTFIDVHIPRLGAHDAGNAHHGHIYLGWCAYPHDGQAADRDRFVRCMEAAFHKAAGKHTPASGPHFTKAQVAKARRRALSVIFRRRVPAAMIAAHKVLAAAEIGLIPHRLDPEDLARWSHVLARSPAGLLEERTGANRRTVEREIWADSLPALPMTVALLATARRLGHHVFDSLIGRDAWVPEAIAIAGGDTLRAIELAIRPPILNVPRLVPGRSLGRPLVPKPAQVATALGYRVASAPKIVPLPPVPRLANAASNTGSPDESPAGE
ncbi:MAG TPA: hypothetical protein VGF29_16775 [Hyphomicrobiaceae bacterium]|jgi:hypothetical protein